MAGSNRFGIWKSEWLKVRGFLVGTRVTDEGFLYSERTEKCAGNHFLMMRSMRWL